MKRPGELTALAFCVAGLAAVTACFVFVEALWRCRPWLPRAATGWAATVVALQAAWVFAPRRALDSNLRAAAAMLALSAVGMAAYVRWTAAALPRVQAP